MFSYKVLNAIFEDDVAFTTSLQSFIFHKSNKVSQESLFHGDSFISVFPSPLTSLGFSVKMYTLT